jgi:hypothetical protein
MEKHSILRDSMMFRPVYLSDLKPIKKVYWEHECGKGCTMQGTNEAIGMNFGIPLNLAEVDGKVIAYSFLNLTENAEPRLHVFVDKDYKEEEIQKSLEQYSSGGNTNAYIDGSPDQLSDIPGIENAIKTLVGWLNKCLS